MAIAAATAIALVDLLTGARPFQAPHVQCVYDEALTLRFASRPSSFGRKWSLLEELNQSGKVRKPPRAKCRLTGNLAKVLQTQLFPFQVGRLRHVLLDHLERIFDFSGVYHDFYAGALAELGGPLKHPGVLVKRLSEFVIGDEGDAEGYAYPQDPAEEVLAGAISPTSALELVGNFFYHAHGREQCAPHDCGADVPVLRLKRVAPLHMRKAFCNYYHFTTVALARVVALLPRLLADPSIVVLIPHPNKKGQRSPYIRDSLRLLGLEERLVDFPPCRLVFAEELLLAGLGPRTAFGRDRLGRARAIMADIADEAPSLSVRRTVLASVRPLDSDILLIDRHERRRMANLADVIAALGNLQDVGVRNHSLIYCENLTFAQQVTLFASANVVVAVSGACLANSLYMKESGLVLDLVPVKNYMGADVVMPLHCGITWFWTLTRNVNVRYRYLLLKEGDLDAEEVHVPADQLRKLLVKELKPEAFQCVPLVRATQEKRESCLEGHSAWYACFQELHWKHRDPSLVTEDGDFITSFAKLQHDVEMLDYLEANSTKSTNGFLLLRALLGAARPRYAQRPQQAFEIRLPRGDGRRKVFARTHNRAPRGPRRGPAHSEGELQQLLSLSALQAAAAQAQFARHGHATMDGVLSSAGVALLREQLQRSSAYYDRVQGMLVAKLEGIASPALQRFVEELREVLPVLGDFCNAVAAKALSDRVVLPVSGEVAFLLWLVPSDDSDMLSLPLGDGHQRVSYAVNRAVLWREDCKATIPRWKMDRSWQSGFLRRKIHLLLHFRAKA